MYPNKMLGDRKVMFERYFNNISITLFEGGHEMIEEVALDVLPIERINE